MLKAAVEPVLGWAGRCSLRSSTASRRVLVLAYHNIVPDCLPPVGDRPLHLPVSAFARQLDLLQECCEVVPLAGTLTTPAVGRLRVAITFDDAYSGALTLGLAELGRRALPATMFVPPGFLGTRTFWWDALAEPEGLSPALRNRALGELLGKDAEVRAVLGGTPAILPPELHSATFEAVALAARQPGFTLGSHTWNHPNLAALAAPELVDELGRPLSWLRQHFPAAMIPWLSYPYGLSTPMVTAAAREAGYTGALRVEGGAFRPGDVDPFLVPRANVPSGVTLDGFALRLAGFRP